MGSRGEKIIKVSGILQGVVFSFALLLVGSLLLGIAVNFSTLAVDFSLNFLFILSYVAVFLGGIIAAYKVENNGWLNGGLVGLFYMVLIVVVGSLWHTPVVSLSLGGRLLLACLVSGLGGMIGINIV